jgi:hypothetical protein
MPSLYSLNGIWKKRPTTIDHSSFSGDEYVVYGDYQMTMSMEGYR